MTPGELLKPRIERIAERASFVITASRLVAAVLAGVLLAGCDRSDPEPRRSVAVRLTDLLYERTSPVPGSTVWYPRATVGEQTRPVLSRTDDLQALLSRSHASLRVDVPSGARLEVGIGVQASEKLLQPVTFEITATADGTVRRLLELDVGADGANRWHDATSSLDGFIGNVTLEFLSSSPVLGTDVAGTKKAVAYFSEPVLTVPVRQGDRRPRNVVLVSLDTLRADHLGVYGYARPTSPNIDRIFSEEGVVVDRFYTNAVDTLRGHAAMLTGYQPTTAIVPDELAGTIVPRTTLLSEILRHAGYRTAAFTENAWVAARFGFARGFELYDEEVGTGRLEDASGYIEQTFDRGLQWVEQHAAEPFFLLLHTYQVHAPYVPPTAYADLFAIPDDAPAPLADAARYDAEVRFTDDQVTRLVETLRRLGVLDDTVLIVTSDHGEEFGEHGHAQHGNNLYEESLRIPMLVRAPGLLPAGVRRSGPMATVDLVPTFAELLGVRLPEERDGESYARHLVDGSPPEPVAIFHEARMELSTALGKETPWLPPSFAVTTWPRRLIRIRTPEGARYELYDLEADPAERTNLWTGNEKKLGFLRARLDRYDEFRSRRRAALAPRPSTPPAGAPAAAASRPDAQGTATPRTGGLDPERARKLRALGYIE